MPVWFNPTTPISCLKCRHARQGCSFGGSNWGVSFWPTILKTAAGDKRRAEEAAKKRGSVKPVAKGGVPEGEGTASGTRGGRSVAKGTRGTTKKVTKRQSKKGAKTVAESEVAEGDGGVSEAESKPVTRSARARGKRAATTKASLSQAPGPFPVAGPSTIAGPSPVAGWSISFFLEEFSSYGDILEDPDASVHKIELKRAELFGILEREDAELALLAKKIRDRRMIGKAMVRDLDVAIAQLNGLKFTSLSEDEEAFSGFDGAESSAGEGK